MKNVKIFEKISWRLGLGLQDPPCYAHALRRFVLAECFYRAMRYRRAIAMMFVRLSVCLSVWDGRAL